MCVSCCVYTLAWSSENLMLARDRVLRWVFPWRASTNCIDMQAISIWYYHTSIISLYICYIPQCYWYGKLQLNKADICIHVPETLCSKTVVLKRSDIFNSAHAYTTQASGNVYECIAIGTQKDKEPLILLYTWDMRAASSLVWLLRFNSVIVGSSDWNTSQLKIN